MALYLDGDGRVRWRARAGKRRQPSSFHHGTFRSREGNVHLLVLLLTSLQASLCLSDCLSTLNGRADVATLALGRLALAKEVVRGSSKGESKTSEVETARRE